MSDISNAIEALQEDFTTSDAFIEDIYTKYFSQYFSREQDLYNRFKSTTTPITDSELEWIITSLPLDLFAASEALAQFKSHNEIIKLTIKNRKKTNTTDDQSDLDTEYKIMGIVYSAVINRVESQISLSKELIMGAKKVWDARRKTEQVPINEVNSPNDLPDYTLKHTYIKGDLNV